MRFQDFVKRKLLSEDETTAAPATTGEPEAEQDPGQVMGDYTTQVQQFMQGMGSKLSALLQNAQSVLASSPDFEAKPASSFGAWKQPGHKDFQAPTAPTTTGEPDASTMYQAYKQKKKRPTSLDEV